MNPPWEWTGSAYWRSAIVSGLIVGLALLGVGAVILMATLDFVSSMGN